MKRLTYLFDHPTHKTLINERCVEIPLIFRYIDFTGGDLTEIGAVSPYYCQYEHDCIDPTDKRATRNDKAEECDFTGLNVLSVSTIEHIGRGDYHLEKEPDLAFKVLNKIYSECKTCLITWPIGYNLELDKAADKNLKNYDYFFVVREEEMKWGVVEDKSGFNHKYGKPFRNANSIIVISKGWGI